MPTTEPATLDDRINFLVEAVDPEIRLGLQQQLRTLRGADNPLGVVLGMSRLAIQLFRLIYRDAGKKWPDGDNLYSVIVRAAKGDAAEKIPGYQILPEALDSPLHTLRVMSNKVDHAAERFRIGVDEAEMVLNALLSVLRWYYCDSSLASPPLPAIYSFGPPTPAGPPRVPRSGADGAPSNLPYFDDAFVGRLHELEQIRFLLVDEAKGVVTITGTGGIGKTRFACEAARALLPYFPGGAFLVELKERLTIDDLCVAIGDAFGLRLDQQDRPIDVIGSFLRSLARPTLLVLDNFEHMAIHADRTVRAWRSTARAVQMLVTSRVSLGTSGEHLFPLPSLDVPPPVILGTGEALAPGAGPVQEPPGLGSEDIRAIGHNEAVRLFCQAASSRGRRFELDAATAIPVVQICQLLQGQPLPIILVAKRARFRPVLDLYLEASESPLEAAFADGQTLRATIAWSYDLLSEGERDVFRQVCVFRDGFTSDAVDEVVAPSDGSGRSAEEFVERLCDYSLVECVPRPDGRTRFTLFQTVLDFGRNLWPEGPDRPPPGVALRWAEYCARSAELWAGRIPTEECGPALDRLVEERENLLAAHRWALASGEAHLASRIILAFAPALKYRGPWTIRVERLLETLDVTPLDDGRLGVLLRIEALGRPLGHRRLPGRAGGRPGGPGRGPGPPRHGSPPPRPLAGRGGEAGRGQRKDGPRRPTARGGPGPRDPGTGRIHHRPPRDRPRFHLRPRRKVR